MTRPFRMAGLTSSPAPGDPSRAYVQEAAGTPSSAEELTKLANLRDCGAISAQDYEQAKAKVLT